MTKIRACSLALALLLVHFLAYSQGEGVYRDPSRSLEERVNDLLNRMDAREKVALLCGQAGSHAVGYRWGIPLVKMSGPAKYANYPVPVALAASWDTALVREVGAAIAHETLAGGSNMLRAPDANLIRNPLAGRNADYYGEDPCLAAAMVVAFIRGVQENGVIACVQNFALSNQEWEKDRLDVRIDERSMREIYLSPFRAAVREGKAGAIETSSNMVNGVYCHEHDHLLNDILLEEWSFGGFIPQTDRHAGFARGFEAICRDTLSNNEPAMLDERLGRIFRVQTELGMFDGFSPIRVADTGLALRAALGSMVLLKNEGGILPLNADSIRSLALIGPRLFHAGSRGSSDANNGYVTPYEGIINLLGEKVYIRTAAGTNIQGDINPLDPDLVYAGQGRKGFSAKYYRNKSCTGPPALFRIDKKIDFNHGSDFPIPAGKDGFSARWDASLIHPRGGSFKIKVIHDGGCRLYIDGKAIIDAWNAGPVRTDSAWINVEAGRSYNLQLDYFSPDSPAGIRLGIDYLPANMIAEAVEKARLSDVAIIFAGTSGILEGEGRDRSRFDIPNQSRLILEVMKANPNTIVVLQTASAVDIESWAFDVPAILQAWLPVKESGNAIAEVLFGLHNPSGKLPFTWAMSPGHYPAMETYKCPSLKAWYLEGLFTGYRYTDRHSIATRFPFGHGLSYTTFGIGKLLMFKNRDESGWAATVEVRNMGSRPGTEVLQLYVRNTAGSILRPEKELRAFRQVSLMPGQKRTISIPLTHDAFAVWDGEKESWTIVPGLYEILIGTSAEAIKLRKTIEVRESR
jgi:beta-glucosidase